MSIFSWTAKTVCKISLSQYPKCWMFDINNTSVFTSQPTVLLRISTEVLVEESSPSAPITAEGFIIFHDHWLWAVEVEDHAQNVAQVARKVRLQLISNACWQREYLKPNQISILRGTGWNFKTKGFSQILNFLAACVSCLLEDYCPNVCIQGLLPLFSYLLFLFFMAYLLIWNFSYHNFGCFIPKESQIEKSQAKKTKQFFFYLILNGTFNRNLPWQHFSAVVTNVRPSSSS